MTAPAPCRHRLPSRRPSETRTLEVAGQAFRATIGFDPKDGQPRELFLSGGKSGSMLDALLGDVAVVVSVALQHGVPATALAKSISRVPVSPLAPTDLATAMSPKHTAPASVIGAALDLLRELEARDAE